MSIYWSVVNTNQINGINNLRAGGQLEHAVVNTNQINGINNRLKNYMNSLTL